MEFFLQILDVDYNLVDGNPIVRIFGRCEDKKTACVFVNGYQPYFYVLPMDKKEDLGQFLNKKFPSQIVKIEEVEKYSPFGYYEKKMKIFKITCKDPSQVPIIRDEIWKEGLAKKIFEADILFKYRFMADKDLHGMRWYKVKGTPVSTSTVKVDRAVDLVSMEPVDEKSFVFKTLSVDIEIATQEGLPNPQKDPIIMISLSFLPDFNGKSSIVLVAKPTKQADGIISLKNEEGMLEEFLKIMDNYDPDLIVGYNINNFDMPYIIDRLAYNNLPRSFGRCAIKSVMSRKFVGKTRNTIVGRMVVDDYELIKEMQVKTQLADKGFPKLKRYGLGDVSKELIQDTKIDIAHSEIPKLWNGSADEVLKLAEYARKDSQLALKIFITRNLLDKFIEISKVSGLLLQDVLDGGEAQRVENILLREFDKRDFVLPLRPSSNEMLKRMDERDVYGFKGALVLDPITGLYTKPVIYLDFKSMYPTIFISFNICPTTLITEDSNYNGDVIETPTGPKFVSKKTRVGIIPQIVENLIAERDKLRNLAKKEKDDRIRKILESKQIAVKYTTNSFYGYTGYIRARTYSLKVATAVTGCGRMLIEKTKQTADRHENLKVVYGDTDSVMVKVDVESAEKAFDVGKELEKEINDVLQGIVEMKIEGVFKSLLILSKKRYAGISMEPRGDGWEERTVMKGIETVRRDWCDLTGETLRNVLDIILREQNPKKALIYIKEIIKKLEKNEVEIEKLVITKSISKSLKEYKGVQPHVEVMKKMRKRDITTAPGVGDRIGFVITYGTQLTSLRAEDPDYVKKMGIKIDSKYYIENQIFPPLERVFEAIGISKSELMGAGKMMTIMEAIKRTPQADKKILQTFDNLSCEKCGQVIRRPPLSGKCDACGGVLLFSKGQEQAKLAIIG